jgi:hypothetical protein
MTRQPIGLHAVTHLPFGSDPVATTSWAYISGTSYTTNTGGAAHTQRYDFPSTKFATNAPDIFTYGVTTFGGGGQHTIIIHKPGTYWAALASFYASGTAGSRYTLYWDNSTVPGFMQIGSPDYKYVATPYANQSGFFEIGYLTAGLVPSGGTMYLTTYDANSVQFQPSLYIWLIDNAPHTNL